MLVVSRRRGQAIQLQLGDQTVLIEVLQIRSNRTVKLGVQAAKSVRIIRLAPGAAAAPPAASATEEAATEGGSLPGAGEETP
jgi:hypothetical protein